MIPQRFSLLLLLLCQLVACSRAQALSCCANIKDNRNCRKACEQLLLDSDVQQLQQLLSAAQHCPPEAEEFWHCVNTSLPVIRDLEAWPGRPCCDLALAPQCQRTCRKALSVSTLHEDCSAETEKSLYNCLQRQDVGETCCSSAASWSCGLVCRSVYLAGSPATREDRDTVRHHCRGASSNVANCMQDQARVARTHNPADSLPCCDRTKSSNCRYKCQTVLQTMTSVDDIIEEVEKACGEPDMRDPLWQCFILTPPGGQPKSPIPTGMDSAKLQCCDKAVSSRCRDLCTKTYNTGWAHHWTEFHKTCSYQQPVSELEARMHNCLNDVSEPCKLGCSGLQFCSNFNNRPTETFRSCNADADNAAMDAIRQWKKGTIELAQTSIHVKDIDQCEPDMWKAIACALQIKPCQDKPSLLPFCMEDCIHILNKCVATDRLTGDQIVPQLCNALPSQSQPGACVSLSKYLTPSPHMTEQEAVSDPCASKPCEWNESCQIRRRKCKHPEKCLPYICKAACILGQVSTVLVPSGTYVRLPQPMPSASETQQCHKVCRCSHRGSIENCSPLPCVDKGFCLIGGGHRKEHGSQFTVDGSQCICLAEELICSHRTCINSNGLTAGLRNTLPGHCPVHYRPVCGVNGKTYPNACLAKCAGIMEGQYVMGACGSTDPCADNPCPADQRCVPRRQVCLGQKGAEMKCPQYECVAVEECNAHHHDEVCDTADVEYSNACRLLYHGRQLAYYGHCVDHCSKSGRVCGHNGESYVSECAALADRTTVDYQGDCKAVSNLTGALSLTSLCSQVKCAPLRPAHCKGVLPPGACCPVCAAELQVLYEERLAVAAMSAMHGSPISVRSVLDLLSTLLTVAQCDVFGFLSLERQLVILVAPITPNPSYITVAACVSEAERLEHMIRTTSPRLMSYLLLSPLLLAEVRTPPFHSMALSSATSLPAPSPVLLLLLLLFLVHLAWRSKS